jgi:hypothetical protein
MHVVRMLTLFARHTLRSCLNWEDAKCTTRTPTIPKSSSMAKYMTENTTPNSDRGTLALMVRVSLRVCCALRLRSRHVCSHHPSVSSCVLCSETQIAARLLFIASVFMCTVLLRLESRYACSLDPSVPSRVLCF